MSASTCDSVLFASQGLHFHGSGTERCFFGMEAAACSRGPAPDRLTPYSSALLSDLQGWRTQCIIWPALMHARCPISAVFGHYSASPGLLPAGDRAGPRRPFWWSLSRSLVPLTWDPCPTIHCCWGKRAGTRVLTIHQTRLIFHPSLALLTAISHPILNPPAMEADSCRVFMELELFYLQLRKKHLQGLQACRPSFSVFMKVFLMIFFLKFESKHKDTNKNNTTGFWGVFSVFSSKMTTC